MSDLGPHYLSDLEPKGQMGPREASYVGPNNRLKGLATLYCQICVNISNKMSYLWPTRLSDMGPHYMSDLWPTRLSDMGPH